MKIKIEKLIHEGWGIGHDQGKAIFVKKSVPGDILDVKITEKKKNYAEAVLEKIIEPSNLRVAPPCPYFNQCGGCEHQNISYVDQLKFKEELFGETLLRQGITVKAEPIMPGFSVIPDSPAPYPEASGIRNDKPLLWPFYYRNSIRFFFQEGRDNKIHFARHHYLYENGLFLVDACLLQSPTCNEILEILQSYINDYIEKKASFWQLKIREGKFSGEFMVEIITSSEELPGKEGIVSAVKKIPGVKSIYHTVAPAESLRHLHRHLLFGSPVIHEKIGSFTFQISPESFFQTNSLGIKTLYDVIKKDAAVTPKDIILDLYCGTGTIGIYLSTLAKRVIGVESVPEAIRDARDNARLNRVGNCEFICTDAEQFIRDLATQPSACSSPPSTIIVDPPRAGLTPKIIQTLSHFHTKLIYVSCNPATFARDIKLFEKSGIVLTKVQPIDMFPQTHHLECVGLLKSHES